MPTVKAEVVSGDNGDPLEGAAISIVKKDGTPLGPGVATGADGRFTLTSALLSGNYLAVSYQGLISVLLPASMLNDREYQQIALYAKLQDPVIVTPRKGSFPWLLLIGITVAAGIAKRRQRHNKKTKRPRYAR